METLTTVDVLKWMQANLQVKHSIMIRGMYAQ